jgi:hypothetical protein
LVRDVALKVRAPSAIPFGNLRRCVGSQHARDLGLRAEVDCTEASKSATPRSADIREGVDYSGMQRELHRPLLISPLPSRCRQNP